MFGNGHVQFGGGRSETQVMLCAGRLSYYNNMAAWMRSHCGFAIPTLVTMSRRYAIVQQAHQLAQTHIEELSAEIEATLVKDTMACEKLKPIL